MALWFSTSCRPSARPTCPAAAGARDPGRLEHDLHRHALHDLHEVAGRVLRRQQAEARAGRAGDAVDVPVNSRPPYASTLIRRRWPGRMSRQLRFLEVRRHPDIVELERAPAAAGRPARPARPRRVFRLTMPRAGAFTAAYCRFSSACASAAFACATCASADAARASVAATCCGRRLRRAQARLRLLLAGSGLREPAFGHADAGLGLDDLRPRRVGRGRCASAAATAASNCCCDTSSFASRPRSRSTSRAAFVAFASASRSRAWAVAEPGARDVDFALRRRRHRPAPARPRPAPCVTLLVAVVDVIGTLLARDQRRGFGVGELGARLVDRDLVVARIDLDEHRAGFDQLVVLDRRARSTVPPTRAAIGVTCASTCASSVDSRPAVIQSQSPRRAARPRPTASADADARWPKNEAA